MSAKTTNQLRQWWSEEWQYALCWLANLTAIVYGIYSQNNFSQSDATMLAILCVTFGIINAHFLYGRFYEHAIDHLASQCDDLAEENEVLHDHVADMTITQDSTDGLREHVRGARLMYSAMLPTVASMPDINGVHTWDELTPIGQRQMVRSMYLRTEGCLSTVHRLNTKTEEE